MDEPYFDLYRGVTPSALFIRSDTALSDPSNGTSPLPPPSTSKHPVLNETAPEFAEPPPLDAETQKKVDGHFKRLGEGFGFSRWFFVTYQGAILGVVLGAAWWRWWERRGRRMRMLERKRGVGVEVKEGKRSGGYTAVGREDEEDSEDEGKKRRGSPTSASPRREWASSSSSSTREGNTTPPTNATKSEDEELSSSLNPLLAQTDRRKRPSITPTHRPRSFRPRSWLKALLIYQPPPLPVLHRIIPCNSTTLLILSLLALNLFYLLYNISYAHPSGLTILADRAGLLFAANLPWLYLMAAKNQPLKLLTGDSYENLNLIHRRQGEWMCFLAALHFFLMVYGFMTFEPRFLTLWGFLTIEYIAWGIGAWVAYELLHLTSLSSFREWWYELFLASHVGLQIAALVFFYLHHFMAAPYVGASLVIFVLDRVVWRLGVKTAVVQADLTVCEDGETVKVSGNWAVESRSDGISARLRKLLGWNMKYGWRPSEHVFITVPGISMRHRLQFHPMTIASAAPVAAHEEREDGKEEQQQHAWFNLIIRAKEGFSRDLLNHARVYDHAQVRLDGPYGSLHALEMLEASDIAIIVAGGSGIAVAYPMLWNLLQRQQQSRRRKSDTAEEEEGGEEEGEDMHFHRKQKIGLIWVVQDASHITWIGNERLEELKDLGCRVVVPPPSRRHGRPDVPALVGECVDELSSSVVGERGEHGEGRERIGVVVSGPDGLNRDVRNFCAGMVWRGREVEVAVEKFGW